VQTFVRPRNQFSKLEALWEKNHSNATPPQSVGSSHKRSGEAQDHQSTSQAKRAKRDEAELLASNATPLSQVPPQAQEEPVVKADCTQAEDAESDQEDVNTEEPAESRIPARSTIWAAQWTKIEAFRRKQHLLAAVGSYALSCPVIEDRYPGLEGQLRLDIKFLPEYTENDGVLEAHLNLGLFKGTIALALDSEVLDIWCYHQSRPINSVNAESQRLRDKSRAARTILGADRVPGSPLKIAPVRIDLAQPLAFWGEFRCQDDRKLFMRPGLIFANTCEVDFLDTSGLNIEGTIDLPMLEIGTVRFEGFKVHELATKTGWRAWSEYDNALIRYGSDWNKA